MPDSRLASLLLLAAFLIRLVSWMGAAIFGTDGCHYLLMADWMGEGRFADALSIPYHPLYPLITAIVRVAVRDTAVAGGLVSVTLGAAAVVPLFHVTRATLGRSAAFVGALLYAFNPSIIDVQSDVLTEGTFTFFLVLSMALTWRLMESPSLAGAGTLGLVAGAAFLTRPEGLLAILLSVAWPLATLIRRRDDRPGLRVGSILVTALVALVLVFPFLLWIRSVQGHWALSMRPSVASAMKSVGSLLESGGDGEGAGLSLTFLKGLLRFTLIVLIPFYLLGFAELRKAGLRRAGFLLSFPLLYLAGILVALRSHDFMSFRYLVPAMAVLTGVAGLGLAAAWRRLAPPSGRAAPAAAAVLLVLAVLPGFRALQTSRHECLSYRHAAFWIATQGKPRAVSGPVQQVAWLTGCRSVYSATSHEGVRRQIAEAHVEYYVYTEKDLEKRPDYVAMLRSCDALGAPVEIKGPAGTWTVYIQKAK